MTPSQTTGIILAGGKSQRMGQDKSMLLWKGEPLLAHVIESLRGVTKEIIIISNHPKHCDFGYTCYADIEIEKGPLGGLYTGLLHSNTEMNIVLSCDTPLVSTELLQYLLASMNSSSEACYLQEGLQVHPLISCYQQRIIPTIKKQLQEGRGSVRGLLRNLIAQSIEVPLKYQRELFNVNTPEDFKALQAFV